MAQKIKQDIIGYIKDMFTHDNFSKRLIMNLISCFVIPVGISTLYLSGFGVDPFTSLMVNCSETFAIEYAILQLLVYSVILTFVILIAKRGLVGVGTLTNAVITGFVFDFCNELYTHIPTATTEFLIFKISCLVVGLIILSFGCSLFFTAGLGVGAYDTIGFMIVRKFKLHYKFSRMITDFCSVILGLAVAGALGAILSGNFSYIPNVGVGTIITAFFMGPLITFFNDKVSAKILAYDYCSNKSKQITA